MTRLLMTDNFQHQTLHLIMLTVAMIVNLYPATILLAPMMTYSAGRKNVSNNGFLLGRSVHCMPVIESSTTPLLPQLPMIHSRLSYR